METLYIIQYKITSRDKWDHWFEYRLSNRAITYSTYMKCDKVPAWIVGI